MARCIEQDVIVCQVESDRLANTPTGEQAT